MENGIPNLQDQICFPLYVCAKEIVRRYSPRLEEFGLTYTQYITMMVLWENKEMRSKQIGEQLFLDSGTLTPVLKRLEEKGWITRCRAKEDERNLWVCITPEGEALREQVKDIPREVAEGVSMNNEDAMALHALLNKLIKQL